MPEKSGKQQLKDKRELVIRKIHEIAPHAEHLIGMLDEIKLDLLLLALGGGEVQLTEWA